MLVLTVVMLCAGDVLAQFDHAPLPAKRRDAIEFIKDRIHHADSVGDGSSSMNWRFELMGFVPENEREELFQEMWQFADSVPGFLDQMLQARTAAKDYYRSIGKWKLASDEAEEVVDLTRRLLMRNADLALRQEREMSLDVIAHRDSVQLVLGERITEAEHKAHRMEATAERWLFIAVGMGAVLVMALVLVFMRAGRQNKRTREEINALREEIAALKVPSGNRFRDPAPSVVAPSAPITAPAPAEPIPPPVIDEKALAFFARMAPERLSALRDARAQGDQSKIMRVVHTLKPHLMTLDRDGLGALCERIKGMEPVQDPADLNIALDDLVSGIEALLK